MSVLWNPDALVPMFDHEEILSAVKGHSPTDEQKAALWPQASLHRARTPADDATEAAVLILLYPHEGEMRLPLMRRTSVDGDVHSGQISLPGGRREANESLRQAALRETHEEIGVQIAESQVVGSIDPLWIPVSGYIVYPFVAVGRGPFEFTPDAREVESVIVSSVEELSRAELRSTFERADRSLPCWRLPEGKVWGATAMILTDLLARLAQARPG